MSNLHSVDAGHSVLNNASLPTVFYFNGYQLPNILISQRDTRWIRTSLLCTVMRLLKNLWAPSLGWTDLCSATLLLIGEFREVQHVWGELSSSCEFVRFFVAVLNPQCDLQWSIRRQMAARCCQDALRASKTKEEVYHVLRLMVRLSDDIGKLQLIEFA